MCVCVCVCVCPKQAPASKSYFHISTLYHIQMNSNYSEIITHIDKFDVFYQLILHFCVFKSLVNIFHIRCTYFCQTQRHYFPSNFVEIYFLPVDQYSSGIVGCQVRIDANESMFAVTNQRLTCWIVSNIVRYIHIQGLIWDLAWPEWIKLTLEKLCRLSVLHNQYHVVWCTYWSSASTGMVLTPKARVFRLQHRES